MRYKVVILDSEKDKVEYSSAYFLNNIFSCKFVEPQSDFLQKIVEEKPDLIVLRLLYANGKEGVEICTQLRLINSLENPIVIFISEHTENYSKVSALNAGADLFFTIPLSKSFFIAQINAFLKRFSIKDEPQDITSQEILIDFERYVVYLEKEEVILPKMEFEILSLLMSQPRKVFSRLEIKSQVWRKPPEQVRNRTIDVHIRKLREKLGEKYIKTVKGVGYKFEVES